MLESAPHDTTVSIPVSNHSPATTGSPVRGRLASRVATAFRSESPHGGWEGSQHLQVLLDLRSTYPADAARCGHAALYLPPLPTSSD